MNIIELAQECKLVGEHPHLAGIYLKSLEDFAKLVAAQEREECAKKCEALREVIWEYHEEHLKAAACNVCTNLANAIRARSNT